MLTHAVTRDSLTNLIEERLKALDEWNFTQETEIEEVHGKSAAEALGRYWELIFIADHFGIKLELGKSEDEEEEEEESEDEK